MYHSLNDVNFVQYKNYKWASAQREFNNPRICFCAAKREKFTRENNSVYSTLKLQQQKQWQWFSVILVPKQ